jgi:D-alanyl-D-alanine carboxypeptidase
VLRRAFAYASAFLIISTAALSGAQAGGNRHAAFVLDANTGAILHNAEADAPRHPASLTKMMTLYLAFETIQSGRLRMSDKLTISEHAAAAAPSKLDLDPGDQISVDDAIKAIVTKSANDIATALAERIGGSEGNFVRLMNARARELGMAGTHYENPSGLPNDEQITTARDMATLALHLQDDFPQYYPFFSTRVFNYSGKSYRNHNTMLNSFAGVDGIKTGYTRASGFNLVTSWHSGSRHLIGVVFGGDTAGERNAEMRRLLTRLVSRASSMKTRKPLMLARLKGEPKIALRPAKHKFAAMAEATPSRTEPTDAEAAPQPIAAVDRSAETPVRIFKVRAVPISTAARRTAPSAEETTDMEGAEETPDRAARPERQVAPVRSFAPAALAAPRNLARPVSTDTPPPPRPVHAVRRPAPATQLASADLHEAPTIRGLPPSTLGAQARALGGAPSSLSQFGRSGAPAGGSRSQYAVQIGAYGSIGEAQRALTKAQDRAGRLLSGVSSVTNPATKNGRQIFRAQFTGLDASRASSACNVLRRQSVDCFVMAGE